MPGLVRRRKADMAMRVLITGLDDGAGEFQLPAVVVFAPAVVGVCRQSGGGKQGEQQCGFAVHGGLLNNRSCGSARAFPARYFILNPT